MKGGGRVPPCSVGAGGVRARVPNVQDVRNMSSVEASATALAGRGSNHSGESTNDDYKIVLPQMPTGITSETSVLLHCDLKGRPYRIQDFRQEMARCGVLGDIAALGAYQMNHVWMATLRTAEAKRRLVDAKELQVKGLRCLVVDPSITEVRLRLHWIPYDVPDDVVRKELEPYGKVLEVSREKWNVEGFQGIESTTRCARMTLNEGGTADTMPHQLRIQGGNVLVVIPGRAPLCLRCKRTGHIRRECRAPKCSECFRFGHYGTECVRSYARVASGAGTAEAETNDHAMDAEEAERTIQGLAPEVSTPAKERKSEGNSSLEAARENGGQPEGAPPSGADVKPSDAGADKESNDASTNGPSDMDDTSESTKRAFDDDTAAGNGARQLHPWMERTKKGRYQPAPNDPKEERRRRESK